MSRPSREAEENDFPVVNSEVSTLVFRLSAFQIRHVTATALVQRQSPSLTPVEPLGVEQL